MRRKVDSATFTPLEKWVIDRFGGKDAKDGVSIHAEKLIYQAGIISPPVRLAKLAKAMGIDPAPLYDSKSTEGAMKVVDGRMRIVLRYGGKKAPGPESPGFNRMRFTYAHELAHSLFYDLQARPPVRMAPEGAYRSEEQLCNRAASRFLVPEFMLQSELSSIQELSPELLTQLGKTFQTSLQTIAYRVADSFSPKGGENRYYILSANVTGIRGLGISKPRCLLCFLPANLRDQGVCLLQSYQGIDRVKRRLLQQSLPWSLVDYFRRGLDKITETKFLSEEVVRSPNGALLELKGYHRTVGKSRMVWTQGTAKLLELPRK
jgi:hypothetical protein